ncbi:MFS transporter [Streptomyces sp. HPF1205]|uniref:MFS transporter n=1 Tax=Streptomyces sp. HPF1205 TaxID=2873262 RepID=UPI001CEC25D1|nr:MFS transporter [Streptomyces sp. HPF1205]
MLHTGTRTATDTDAGVDTDTDAGVDTASTARAESTGNTGNTPPTAPAPRGPRRLPEGAGRERQAGLPRQPTAVWATAGAAVVAFMGIGLVDPILPSIAKGLDATPGQVSLLFTSYFLITAVAMLITGFVSSRIGGRATLLAGLALVVVFAGLAGTSGSVGELVGFRAGWGLGNALFVSTSLAVIVGAASGGAASAILLYESALGLGMACGPLLGAVLGAMKWRYPFFGTAALMAIGFVAISLFLKEQPRPARRTGLLDPLRALGHGGLASAAASAFFYNYAFFTVLAFTPFVLDMSPYRSGAVFFAWGGLLAVFSVLVAPRLQTRLGSLRVLGGSLVLLATDLLVLGYGDHRAAVAATIASGALIGLSNTVYTEIALGVSDAPRPVASAGYNFVRWFAAAAAPYLAPKLAEHLNVHVPFLAAAGAAVAAAGVVAVRRRHLVVVHAEDVVDGRA